MTPTPFPNPNDGAGDWSEYSRLILHQLQQLSDGYEGIRRDLSDFLRQQDADRLAVEALKKDTDRRFDEAREAFTAFRDGVNVRFDDPKKGLDGRVEMLEDSNTIATAFKKGRWWVVTGAFLIITAIVLPTVSLLWKG